MTMAAPSAPSRPGRVTPADYQALASFRQALRRFMEFSAAAARATGLTPQQHQTLLAIKGYAGPGRLTIGELAERLYVRPHSAVGLVDRLAARGLLRRLPDKDDRRRVSVILTARGEKLLARLSLVHRDELRRIGPELQHVLKRLAS